MTPPRTLMLCAAGATILVTLAMTYQAGLRFNTTPSMPIGLWEIVPGHAFPKRGDIVMVCLPDGVTARLAIQRGYIARGACPNGAEPLVKPVAAAAGDMVTVSATGISVNATPISNSTSLARDEAGRPLHAMPGGSYHLAPGELWLLSGHDNRSFDSRYFGAVAVANVLGVARPVWVLR
jgi:conjugative transfer signal peptidase TraF